MSKNVLVIGDLHCGSLAGLTPPKWMISKSRNAFFSKLQEEMWENYTNTIKDFGKIDIVVINGDAIDGKGTKSGGTELITNDMIEQTDIAIEAISEINASKFLFTYGTPYHTSSSSGEDFDKIIANAFNSKIYDELNLNIDGLLMNIKHKIGRSSSTYNRATPVGKQHIWDVIKSLKSEDEKASVYIRSHVHYFSFCGESDWTGFTLPALQASNTKFGARQCEGATDWGMCLFKINNGTLAGWDCKIFDLSCDKKQVVRI